MATGQPADTTAGQPQLAQGHTVQMRRAAGIIDTDKPRGGQRLCTS